ncbi:RanGTP-binding protein [Histoplasma capsulatum H143]|uniref:RanGTP-binding protein n=1 Tax=Ajellomyces capsulatus (strain H143) TaxID=544712 RepID=C6HD80_AJECH|nr:RanGTP-binding protein [Histoplasma capsulatum H143]
MSPFYQDVTQQAMNYAIRSGITITAGYAIRQSAKLLKTVSDSERVELQTLQERLQSKIKIISPAIDMIELIAARGNTSLESALALTKSLRWDIQNLGLRLSKAVSVEELYRKGAISVTGRTKLDGEIKSIIKDIRNLLQRIEDAVPLINLAITTSGANLSTSLPSTVSPSRLLQASTFLTSGDTQYSMSPSQPVQIGPTFTLSVYMLFSGHIRPVDEESVRNTTWKEVIHKARVKLRRVSMDMIFPSYRNLHRQHGLTKVRDIREEARKDEFAYQILIIEDLDDGRVHTDVENMGSYEDVDLAGIREIIPIHEISKIFYADTGKILNIGSEGETNNPILLLKRDTNAIPPRQETGENSGDEEQSHLDAQLLGGDSSSAHLDDQSESQKYKFPRGLDLEWIAFEVHDENEDSDSETEAESDPEPPADASTSTSGSTRKPCSISVEPQLSEKIAQLHLQYQYNGADAEFEQGSTKLSPSPVAWNTRAAAEWSLPLKGTNPGSPTESQLSGSRRRSFRRSTTPLEYPIDSSAPESPSIRAARKGGWRPEILRRQQLQRREGSQLVRPETGQTDQELGASPASIRETSREGLDGTSFKMCFIEYFDN